MVRMHVGSFLYPALLSVAHFLTVHSVTSPLLPILEKEQTQSLIPHHLRDDASVCGECHFQSVTHKTGISGHFCLNESGPGRMARLATDSPRAAVDTLSNGVSKLASESPSCHAAHCQCFRVNLGATDFPLPLEEPGQVGGSWMGWLFSEFPGFLSVSPAGLRTSHT